MSLTISEKQLEQKKGERDKLFAERSMTNLERINNLDIEILSLERIVCAQRNQPYAEIFDFGSPVLGEPIVISNYKASVLLSEQGSGQVIAIFFYHVQESRLGGLNDEVFESHELAGCGLDVYGEYTVKNSKWIESLRRANSVHPSYSDAFWDDMSHYLIRTKEGEYACVAKSFKLYCYSQSLSSVYDEIKSKVVDV